MLLLQHDIDLAANFVGDEHIKLISERHIVEGASLFFRDRRKAGKAISQMSTHWQMAQQQMDPSSRY